MVTFKRNQVLEAISMTLGEGPTPSGVLRTDAKRLLDTDRSPSLKPDRRSNNSERANYAFFSATPPGRGFEVLFSDYEAFALLLGIDLFEASVDARVGSQDLAWSAAAS